MTTENRLAVLETVIALARQAKETHDEDYGHELCPWAWGDAYEFEAAWDYLLAVVRAAPPPIELTP